MLQIRTEFSTYELDGAHARIRRVAGEAPATECFSPDGDWKPYRAMSFLEIGRRAQIVWPDDAPHQFTVLSEIQELTELKPTTTLGDTL